MPHKLPIHLSTDTSSRYLAGQMFIKLIHQEILASGLATGVSNKPANVEYSGC